MARTYLVRGMLAGLVAGLLAIAFAKIVAEPQIASAEHFEARRAAQSGRPGDRPLVSRDVQDTVGLGAGVAVTGVALGGLYGLVFGGIYRRVGNADGRTTAAGLSAASFIALFVVPFLKYPANPPAIGNPDTIGRRTALYFLMVAVGVLSVVLAVIVHRRSLARWPAWYSRLAALGVFLGVVTICYVVMPGIDEVPVGFPASVLWKFRLASAGTELVLWAALGLIFGALTDRSESRPVRA